MKSQLAEAKQQAELYRFQFEELRSQRAVHRPGEAPSIVPQLQESRSNALRAALSRAKEEVEQLESLMDPEESPEDPRHDGEEDHEDFEGSGSSESDDEGETGEVVPKADDKPLTAEEIEVCLFFISLLQKATRLIICHLGSHFFRERPRMLE